MTAKALMSTTATAITIARGCGPCSKHTRQRLRPSGLSPRWGSARTRLVDGAGLVGRRLGRALRPTDGRASPLPVFEES